MTICAIFKRGGICIETQTYTKATMNSDPLGMNCRNHVWACTETYSGYGLAWLSM